MTRIDFSMEPPSDAFVDGWALVKGLWLERAELFRMAAVREGVHRVFQAFQEGGLGMYPLLGCAAVLVAFVIERGFALFHPRPDHERLLGELSELIRDGDLSACFALAAANPGADARVAHAALARALGAPTALEATIRDATDRELAIVSRRIAAIPTVGALAALFGLFGSILGLQRSTGLASSEQVVLRFCQGISESMTCLGLGLLVLLASVALHHAFGARAVRLSAAQRQTASALLGLLSEHRGSLRWGDARARVSGGTYRTVSRQ